MKTAKITIMDTPTKPRIPKGLVEDHVGISIGDFGRSLLRQTEGKYKSGWTYPRGKPAVKLDYEVQRNWDEKLVLHFSIRGMHRSWTIKLEPTQSSFGLRPWFMCGSCGTRRYKLYYGRNGFACRACLRLGYEDRRSMLPIFYAYRQHWKIAEASERVRTVSYAGRYTRRARAVMHRCAKLEKATL